MKLSVTQKPVAMQDDVVSAARQQGANEPANAVSKGSYKATVHLAACGNFQRDAAASKEDPSSENVSADGRELAVHEGWEAMSFDVSCVF